MNKKPRRWKGELARPIRPKVNRPQRLSVIDVKTIARVNKEMHQLIQQAIEKSRIEKLALLMEHYGITDQSDFFGLALALAVDHVPGFQIDTTPLRLLEYGDSGLGLVIYDSKVGRPRDWSAERFDRLLSAQEKIKKSRQCTDREALESLVQHREWAPPTNHRGTRASWIETLESRLQDAKKIRRMAERHNEELKTIARDLKFRKI